MDRDMNEDALLAASAELRRSGDADRADKLVELNEKRQEKRFYIAFCGHFSAGKSTMINRLCGHSLLPSSPIPTSANIVAIRDGEPGAKIIRILRDGQKRSESVGLGDLEEACKDGETVESVEITYPIPLLGGITTLLDTPGIDSTDDAHRMSTESALHLADVVFYMMDYNHVQSELNFAFTKQLKEWGKPVYLIVNQVDKHKGQELPFEDYRSSVRDSFAQWRIEPDGILYLSLKEPDHPLDEWDTFVALLEKLIAQSDELRNWSVERSAQQVIRQHMKAFSDERESRKTELRDEAESQGDPDALSTAVADMRLKYDEWLVEADRKASAWKKEAESIIDNANLIPAGTRDLAGRYLETRKPGFKVGFFSRAAQTEKETASRLETLQGEFAERIQVGLTFHLKNLLKQIAEAHSLEDAEPLQEIDRLEKVPDAQWLAKQVSGGAVISGEYTMTYSKLISSEMKAEYRRNTLSLLLRMQELLQERFARSAADLAADIGERERQLGAYRELQAMEREERDRLQQLLQTVRAVAFGQAPALPDPAALAPARAPGAAAQQPAPAQAHAAAGAARGEAAPPAQAPAGGSASAARPACAGAPAAAAAGPQAGEARGQQLRREASRLREAAALLGELPAMKSLVRAMQEKAERMTQSRFTIALFGAFSAGKSSLANALMGERILPVSPNPTTAAINKIAPPTEEWPHGTAKVKMKPRETMLEEVRYSLNVLGKAGGDWEACLAQIHSVAADEIQAGGKPHFTFLKAFEKGWAESGPHLGQELKIDLNAFAGYVADESKSCFVETIELYHSNPLTEQGIVLVDTPGADSINARHTGVAFNYIKNADAILFVTYYNHAFSQADREFLMQLGRVKDAFEMDKMFFLVNASDLAADENEMQQVIGHVEANLLKHGIRQARLYPISSQQALLGKLQGDESMLDSSGLAEFERDFFRFTVEELTSIAVRSARQELERALPVLDRWLAGAKEGDLERERKRQALSMDYRGAEELLAKTELSAESGELDQEIRELLYYVKQRVQYRFGEFFQLAFNPSSLQEDGRDMKKALRASWLELVRLLSYSLSQEVLATTLRVEQYLNKQSRKKFMGTAASMEGLLGSFPYDEYESHTFYTPEVEEELAPSEPESRWLAGMFKNGRSFFEGDGKKKLREELETRLAATIDAYIEKHRGVLEAAYSKQNAEWSGQLQDRLLESAKEHYEGLNDALEQKTDFEKLSAIRQKLQALLG